jgi:putative addiction module component (TIGR02574 family)
MEANKELLQKVIELDPVERIALVESILRSLDEPDANIEQIWLDEAERRLIAHRAGKSNDLEFGQVF